MHAFARALAAVLLDGPQSDSAMLQRLENAFDGRRPWMERLVHAVLHGGDNEEEEDVDEEHDEHEEQDEGEDARMRAVFDKIRWDDQARYRLRRGVTRCRTGLVVPHLVVVACLIAARGLTSSARITTDSVGAADLRVIDFLVWSGSDRLVDGPDVQGIAERNLQLVGRHLDSDTAAILPAALAPLAHGHGDLIRRMRSLGRPRAIDDETSERAQHRVVVEAFTELRTASGHAFSGAYPRGYDPVGSSSATSGAAGMAPSHATTRAKSDIPPALRRKVNARDHGRCRVPWCRSSRNVDQHHMRPRSQGGQHTFENVLNLCESHHLAHHAGALIIEGTATNATFTRRAHSSFAVAERLVETTAALRTLGFDKHEVSTAVEKAHAHVGTAELTLEQWIKIALSYCPKPRAS